MYAKEIVHWFLMNNVYVAATDSLLLQRLAALDGRRIRVPPSPKSRADRR